MVFNTSQMPLLTTLAFAKEKKEVRQIALPSALSMGQGHPIRLSVQLEGRRRTTSQSDGHNPTAVAFHCVNSDTPPIERH
jgi:hypothetical protein